MVFTKDPSSMLGTVKSLPIRAATARGRPGDSGDVEANRHRIGPAAGASRGGMSHNDAPTGHGFHQGTNLHDATVIGNRRRMTPVTEACRSELGSGMWWLETC